MSHQQPSQSTVLSAYGHAIASLGTGTPPTIEWRICPDQYVGLVDVTWCHAAPQQSFSRRESIPRPPEGQPPIIMILESPHKREFLLVPPGPADGSTGTNIRKWLKCALITLSPGVIRTLPRPLVLMNAIQHQTSLGAKTTKHRDHIFQKMWEDDAVRADFLRRLWLYRTPGSFVINACTKGYSPCPKKLFELVEEEIRTVIPSGSDISIRHPGSWIPKVKGGLPRFTR